MLSSTSGTTLDPFKSSEPTAKEEQLGWVKLTQELLKMESLKAMVR